MCTFEQKLTSFRQKNTFVGFSALGPILKKFLTSTEKNYKCVIVHEKEHYLKKFGLNLDHYFMSKSIQ